MMKNPGIGSKIILLNDERYPITEIRIATNHDDINIRKWIHRFNEKCIDGIFPRKHKYKHKDKPVKIPVDKETKIVEMASKNPRMLWPTFLYMAIEDTGMTEYVSKEINLVDSEVTPRLETYS